jgi:hypothetical protein
MTVTMEDFADAYARWAAGCCPCCGGGLGESPEPIGEGVMLCGRCIENEHHLTAGEFVPMMLAAIAKGATPLAADPRLEN